MISKDTFELAQQINAKKKPVHKEVVQEIIIYFLALLYVVFVDMLQEAKSEIWDNPGRDYECLI